MAVYAKENSQAAKNALTEPRRNMKKAVFQQKPHLANLDVKTSESWAVIPKPRF
jgi:hypothetical protein